MKWLLRHTQNLNMQRHNCGISGKNCSEKLGMVVF